VDALAALAAEPGRAALFLDIDGTLAPIVDEPSAATVPEATRRQLRRLARTYALVACVSGRPEEDARVVVGVPELTFVGEHGLGLAPEAQEWAGRIHAFAETASWPVEEKPLSAAFHYRTAPDRVAARAQLEEVAERAQGLGFRTRWGRMVLEVLPPVEASKGTAVRALLERSGLRRALFAGDDSTDLDGFAALAGLEVGVRVAVASPEGPSRLADEADVVVPSPAAFADLLERL
jgi:trehalose 6-phosphate phosphatase